MARSSTCSCGGSDGHRAVGAPDDFVEDGLKVIALPQNELREVQPGDHAEIALAYPGRIIKASVGSDRGRKDGQIAMSGVLPQTGYAASPSRFAVRLDIAPSDQNLFLAAVRSGTGPSIPSTGITYTSYARYSCG